MKRLISAGVVFFAVYGIIWNFAEPLGLTVGVRLLTILLAASAAGAGIMLGVKHYVTTRQAGGVVITLAETDKFIGYFENCDVVRVFASSSETYLALFKSILPKVKRARPLEVRILFRDGGEVNRQERFEEYKRKWAALSEMNVRTTFQLYDFEVMIRGLVFDNAAACLGFYRRNSNLTVGQEHSMVLVLSTSRIGKFLIDESFAAFEMLWSQSDSGYRIRGIVIDLDGTLYSNSEFALANRECAALVVARDFGVSKDEAHRLLENRRTLIKEDKGYEPSLAEVMLDGIGISLESWDEIRKDYKWPIANLHQSPELICHMQSLHRRFRILILTNNSRDISLRVLERLGLTQYVDQVYSLTETKAAKPNKKVLEGLLKEQGLRKEEVIFLGDRIPVDLIPALQAGLLAALVSDEFTAEGRMRQLISML